MKKYPPTVSLSGYPNKYSQSPFRICRQSIDNKNNFLEYTQDIEGSPSDNLKSENWRRYSRAAACYQNRFFSHLRYFKIPSSMGLWAESSLQEKKRPQTYIGLASHGLFGPVVLPRTFRFIFSHALFITVVPLKNYLLLQLQIIRSLEPSLV